MGRRKGFKHSEETKKKLSEIRKGEKNPFYGRNHSEEVRKMLSKKGRQFRHKEETKKRISEANKGVPKSESCKKKLSELYKGKTYEELHGPKKAKEIKEKQRQANLDQKSHLRFPDVSGENNPNWRGGINFLPYTKDFNEKFKRAIKERDNHCCVVCNKKEEELKWGLSIHHVDYDKKNTFPQNCVSVCRNHHSDTNWNRERWKKFFQDLLKERYGYEYTQDQKVILDYMRVEDE